MERAWLQIYVRRSLCGVGVDVTQAVRTSVLPVSTSSALCDTFQTNGRRRKQLCMSVIFLLVIAVTRNDHPLKRLSTFESEKRCE